MAKMDLAPSDVVEFVAYENQWLDFANGFQEANIFHHPAWINTLIDTYRFPAYLGLVRDSKGAITAGIPCMVTRRLGLDKKLVALPFTDYCEPLFYDSTDAEILLKNWVFYAQNVRVKRIEVRSGGASSNLFQKKTEYCRHVLNLHSDYEKIASQYLEKYRIKVSQKRGVTIIKGSDLSLLEDFYRLHLKTRQRLGVPIQPKNFFMNLWKNLICENLGFIASAYHEGKCVASVLFLCWNGNLTYKFSASDYDSRKLMAMDALVDNVIRWGCENNYRTLDFGRTDIQNEGLKYFKHRWGSSEILLPYAYYPLAPSNSLENSKRMMLIHNVIQKSPLWVCRILGETFYRYFG